MTGYIIGQAKVHDQEGYMKYLQGVMHTFKPFEGRILVASDDADVLEGEWPKVRTIVIEFPSKDLAKAWYESDQYQKVAEHRFKAAKSNLILIDGLPRR